MAVHLAILSAISNIITLVTKIISSMLKQLHGLSQRENGDASTMPQSQVLALNDTQAKKRSQAIDRALEEDAKIRRRQWKVLPLGAFSMGEIIKQLKNNDEMGLTKEELISYRYDINQCVISHTKVLVEAIEMSSIKPKSDTNNDYYGYLRGYIIDPDPDVPLNDKVGKAIDALWRDSSIAEAFKSDLIDSARYFFENIGRITTQDYIPTEADILRLHKGTRGVSEHRFVMGELSIYLIDVGTQRCERRKWIHQFENITAILHVVDLALYDQVVSSENAMMDQIQLFNSVVNSKWFTKTTIILFLSNVSVFRQKLARNPLGNYFPDYSGGTDINMASEYLLERFIQVNRTPKQIYTHLVDPYDTSNMQFVFAAIADSILLK